MELHPTLVVLAAAGVAAAVAPLGILPLTVRREPPVALIGAANALAAGIMLGAAYILSAGFEAPVSAAAGAVVGVLAIHMTHAASGTSELDLNRLEASDPVYSYRVLLVGTLHSAAEGVAIGVAMAVDLRFGLVMAAAMAVHNVPEATVLGAVLRGQGATLRAAAGLVLVVDASQILLAVTTHSIVVAAPAAVPWAQGFAAGALIDLVLVELLPESYRELGRGSIALVAAAAMGAVVLLHGFS